MAKNKKLIKKSCKGNKKLEKEPLPLVISIPLFLISWYLFIFLSFNFTLSLIHLINSPTAFGLFLLPIAFAICFIFGFFTLITASHISRGLKQLKKRR